MHNIDTNSPAQLYSNGITHFSHRDFKQGIECFKQAALKDYNPAIKELGLCFLYGIGIKHNLSQAIKYFKKSKSEAESQYELMKCYYFGYGVTQNLEIARKLLILSVQNNYNPALNLMAICFVLNGESKKANVLLNKSLLQNDAFSQHLMHLNLINTDNEKIDFLKLFNWPEIKKLYKQNVLNQNPNIFTIDALISELECEYIKYVSSPFMRESMTVNPETNELVKDNIRTSYSATIDWLSEDPAINLIMQKCCLQFNEPAENSEVLHVLHYSVGEEYKPHYDFIGGLQQDESKFQSEHQRIKSICLYLNNVKSGGATSFPKLNLNVTPNKGSVVFFENINFDNKQPYIESLHAGEPVIQGEKWLATLWLRDSTTNRGPNYE